jgi:hypothetical protein
MSEVTYINFTQPEVVTGNPNRQRSQRQEGESRPAPQRELPEGARSFLEAIRGDQQIDTER